MRPQVGREHNRPGGPASNPKLIRAVARRSSRLPAAKTRGQPGLQPWTVTVCCLAARAPRRRTPAPAKAAQACPRLLRRPSSAGCRAPLAALRCGRRGGLTPSMPRRTCLRLGLAFVASLPGHWLPLLRGRAPGGKPAPRLVGRYVWAVASRPAGAPAGDRRHGRSRLAATPHVRDLTSSVATRGSLFLWPLGSSPHNPGR